MTRLLKIVLPIVIVALALVGTQALVRSRPEVETKKPEPVIPLVRVVVVEKQDVPLTVRTQGTVLPQTETTLAAQVAAQVTAVSSSFVVGGFFERGAVLVSLDRRDFELAIESANARVAQARVRLARQEAEARVAREEWERLGEGEPDPLVLREPQIAEAKAALAAADAELRRARLDLERTSIRAPFSGRLRRKMVDLGHFLTPGEEIATIHAIDQAEVRLPISHHELAYLDISLAYKVSPPLKSPRGDKNGDSSAAGPLAVLSALFAGQRHTWPGRIVRTEGELDAKSRMLHLVARVEDPYSRFGTSERPPLAVGLFVEAEIAGHTLRDAVLLPRAALRNDDQVLVVDGEDRLRFRQVEVLRLDGETAIIGAGLEIGERACVSPLDIVVDGMKVQTTEVEGPRAPLAPALESAKLPVAPVPAKETSEAALAAAPSSPATMSTGTVSRASRLLSVGVVSGGESTVFQIAVDGEFELSWFQLRQPDRVVLDLEEVVNKAPRSTVPSSGHPVTGVRIAQFASEPTAVVRVVFDLERAAPPRIERTDSGLAVHFDPD